jgi:hypothetical protein
MIEPGQNPVIGLTARRWSAPPFSLTARPQAFPAPIRRSAAKRSSARQRLLANAIVTATPFRDALIAGRRLAAVSCRSERYQCTGL